MTAQLQCEAAQEMAGNQLFFVGCLVMRYLLFAFCTFLLFIGCDSMHMHLHPHAEYLKQAAGRDNHDSVARMMGAPHRTVRLDKGGDLWTYDYCPYGTYLGNAQCQRLNLIFDESGTLAEWSDK